MKQKESNISAITFMWIGMLVTGLILVIVAFFIHSSNSKEVEDTSLTLLMEEKFKEQDEEGKELTSDSEGILKGSVPEKDDPISNTSVNEEKITNTNVDDATPKLPMKRDDIKPNDTDEETEIAPQSSEIDINSATSEQLQQLKGIGPSKATAIIEDREQKGKFKNIVDIKRVKGIGEKLYAGIQESIVAEP